MTPHLQRARLLLEQQRWPEAEREFRQSLALDPNDPLAHGLLAVALLQQDRLDEAEEASDMSLHLAPDVAFFYRIRSILFHERKDYETSEQVARRALELDPEDPAQYAALAAPLLAMKRWPEALDICEKGLQIEAQNVDLLNRRAVALTMLGQRDEAGKTIDVALQEQPENSTSHANMGWTLLHAGQHDRALEHFKEALRLDPGSDWARQGIVEALKARGLVYRALLKFSLWMSRLSTSAQWMLVIGLVVAVNLVGRIESESTLVKAGVGLVTIGYTIFVFLVWLQGSLFNLLLRADKFGRLVLTDRQKNDTNWIALALLTTVALIAAHYFLLQAVVSIYALPLLAAAVTLSLPAERRKLPVAITAAIYAVMLLFFARMLPPLQPEPVKKAIATLHQAGDEEAAAQNAARISMEDRAAVKEYFEFQDRLKDWFVWGSVGMTWLGSFFHSRR